MLFPCEEERRAILELAREAVRYAVLHGKPLSTFPKTGIFAERCGLFVSLHAGKKLRGCIGIIESPAALGESLVQSAADAALRDPRFSPVRAHEVDGLDIEVSLLSPMQPIRPEDVEIGRHGLLAERGGRRGLLLPQVATEHELSREQFLSETCIKAGLPREAWREPETRMYGFECVVVAEHRT